MATTTDWDTIRIPPSPPDRSLHFRTAAVALSRPIPFPGYFRHRQLISHGTL